MGCGSWYMVDSPQDHFPTYKELLLSTGREVRLKRTKEHEKIGYSKYVRARTHFEKHPKKSRANYTGMTVKSNLKSDRKITVAGKDVFVDKTPRVANDHVGTHESVKEFFFNEERRESGTIDTGRGFYNRISVDSDEDNEILPRLRSVAEHASVSGFWFIINNANNKFQASIAFSHTVINGHDVTKVKEVAKCLNELTGDVHMTNSFMKNHKVRTDPSEVLHMGAQVTRTFGFDTALQTDFEDYVRGRDDYNWEHKWITLVQRGEIRLGFIDSTTGKGTAPDENSICVILPDPDPEFNIRKTKDWSVSIETLWTNTVLKYARQKTECGVRYTGIEHGSKSQTNMSTFHIVSSVLKDNIKTPYNTSVINKNIIYNTEKYTNYYKDSMRVYNPFVFQDIELHRTFDNFGLLRALVKDRESMLSFVSAIKSANQDGVVSLRKKHGLLNNWTHLCENESLSGVKPLMEVLRKEELDLVRTLFPVLVKVACSWSVQHYKGRAFNDLPSQIRPLYSIANEVVYYGKPGIVRGVSKSCASALTDLSVIDYELYRNIGIDFVFAVLIENSVFSGKLKVLNRLKVLSQNLERLVLSKYGYKKKWDLVFQILEEIEGLLKQEDKNNTIVRDSKYSLNKSNTNKDKLSLMIYWSNYINKERYWIMFRESMP